MKPRFTAQRGSVVLVALCLVTVLGVAVAGYVSLCARSMEMSNRSFCYTGSTQLAEIGMEEALWSLNQALNTSGYSWSGWTLTTVSGVPTATKTLTGFTTNVGIAGTATISIANYNTTTPYTVSPTVTVDGVMQMTDGVTIDKQLSATVKPAVAFCNALGSTAPSNSPTLSSSNYYGYVSFYSDSSVLVDSYDSTQNSGNYTPSLSTVNRSDQAIISGPYLYMSNANILGYATTANSSATIPSFNSSGTLKSFSTSSSTKVDSSRISNNGNQPTFDIVAPTTAASSGLTNQGILPTSGSIASGYYYYTAGDWVQSAGSTLTITGPATIYIPNSFYVQGSIVISASSTGPVQIYVGGYVEIYNGSGTAQIDNQTKLPNKLAIVGSTTWALGYLYSPTAFYGVIYMPNTTVYMYGFGSNQAIYGSIVAAQVVSFFTSTNIHYDLNLRKTTFSLINTPYDIAQWTKN